MPVEMADRDTVVPIITMADDLESVDAFVDAFAALVERQQRATPRCFPSSRGPSSRRGS